MHIGRKCLPHTPPPTSTPNPEEEVYFITICCRPRGMNQLATPNAWAAVQESTERRHRSGQWKVRLLLAMPDHMHMLVSFPSNHSMKKTIRSFKSWLAKQYGIAWQDGFFDHRLRTWESAEEKRRYIMNNPVRAKLVERVSEWSFWWQPDADVGEPG